LRLDRRLAGFDGWALAAWLIGAGLAVLWLVLDPPSDDLASAVYRADLFGRHGFQIWDDGWYAGHHLLGYSVLFPVLGALLGPKLLGVLATVAAVVLFERLVARAYGPRSEPAAVWFAIAAAASLWAGRIPFALGLALGLAALLALERSGRAGSGGAPRRERWWSALAVVLALATGLSSPVAGLFLALAGIAWGAFAPSRRVLAAGLVAAAIGPPAVLAVVYAEGGSFPFHFGSYLPCLLVAALLVVALPRGERTLRLGAVLFAALATVAFAFEDPVGGNAARLGMLFAGPVLAASVLGAPKPDRWRMVALAGAALPLLWWPIAPVVRQLRDSDDPGRSAAYYRPLLGFLARQPRPLRVEVPPTRFHWEAADVAKRFPIARGWERQLDIRYGKVFYEGRLTPDRYLRWLRANGTGLVALPVRARPDYAAKAERRLLVRGVPGLQEVWSTPDWRVWRVPATPWCTRHSGAGPPCHGS
jgi:hypothetical protein